VCNQCEETAGGATYRQAAAKQYALPSLKEGITIELFEQYLIGFYQNSTSIRKSVSDLDKGTTCLIAWV
jgi:hypothetical protein